MSACRRPVAAAAALACALACGCSRAPEQRPVVAGGDAARGRIAIAARHCGACHQIPGIRGATGTVGPPLAGFGRRAYIAGLFPNEAGRLVQWIADAPGLDPRTAMPDMDIGESEARDMAAYLYSQ
jgi:cytochrome c1